MFKKNLTLAALVVLLVPQLTMAETVYRAGSSISVASDQVVEGDFYAAGTQSGSVVMSGTVMGDVYAAAGKTTINGEVNGDVALLSGNSQLHASITDDVRVAGFEVTIAGPVAGDVFVYAGNVTILSTATIGGDVFFFGGQGEIKGPVAGNIRGEAYRLRIDNTVGGSVEVEMLQGLTLGDRAVIEGNVALASPIPLVRAQQSVVNGEIIERSIAPVAELTMQVVAMTFLVFLVTSLVLLLIAKPRLQVFARATMLKVGIRGVVGIAVLLVTPLVISILYVTELGAVLALILLIAYLLGIALAVALSGVMMGAILARAIVKKAEVNILWVTIGTAVVVATSFVPFVGPLVLMLLVSITLGSLFQVAFDGLGSSAQFKHY